MSASLETANNPAGLHRVAIDPVSRVEGHGKVTIHLNRDNQVDEARLRAVGELLAGGSLAIYTASGNLLVTFGFKSPAATAQRDLLTFDGFPLIAAAVASGRAASASLFAKDGDTVGTGMTVRDEKTKDGDITLNVTDIKIGNLVKLESVELRHS